MSDEMASSPADARWSAGHPDAPPVRDKATADNAAPASPDKAGPDQAGPGQAGSDERRSESTVMRGARCAAVVVLAAAAPWVHERGRFGDEGTPVSHHDRH